MLLQNLHGHCSADGADKNDTRIEKTFRFLKLRFRSANLQGKLMIYSKVQIEAKQFLCGKAWHAHDAIMMLPA